MTEDYIPRQGRRTKERES